MQLPRNRTRAASALAALPLALALSCAGPATGSEPSSAPETHSSPTDLDPVPTMELGNFSVSLAVKDLQASLDFYTKLGFREFGGDASQGWLILQNDTATIGLFQGMFERNIMTFNPGWDRSAGTLPEFTDVRDLQRELEAQGIEFASRAEEEGDGPASFVVVDPDGNPVLIDQHVPRAGS